MRNDKNPGSMPASKKGTQGKAGATSKNVHRRSTSRQTTPLTEASTTPATATPSAKDAPAATMTPYLKTSTAALISTDPSIETLIDRSNGSAARPGDPPTVRELRMLHDTIRDTVNRFMSKRGEVCDRSMRQLVQRRKERLQEEREQEAARDAERARVKREEERSAKDKKTTSKKRHADEMDVDADEKERKEALPNVGAHGLARQDGVGVHQGKSTFLFTSIALVAATARECAPALFANHATAGHTTLQHKIVIPTYTICSCTVLAITSA